MNPVQVLLWIVCAAAFAAFIIGLAYGINRLFPGLLGKINLSQGKAAIVTGISFVGAILAIMPDSLTNQVPQFFPEGYRAKIAVALAIIAGVSHMIPRAPSGKIDVSAIKPEDVEALYSRLMQTNTHAEVTAAQAKA